jgi:drug/metabolite transporter (DMT)-like permease
MYIPISFLYILPVSYFGWFQNSIPRAHITSISKKPFMVMGALDSLSAAMQILASVYLPGKLLVLLPQAAIPFSMIASRWILREHFTRWQYMGAAVVFGGIGVVLFPVLTQRAAPEYSCQALDSAQDCTVCQMETTAEDCLAHQKEVLFADDSPQLYCQWVSKDESLRHDDFLVFVWSLVMVASCIPMVLSSVYKQVALQVHLDPILVNGWVAIFQLLCSLPLAILAGLVSSPSVRPVNLPENWWQASQCLFDNQNFIELGCHPDDCVQAALWVHLGLLSSVVYTMSVIFVLKYGSSSMLYLGLTAVVPLGHLVFAVHSPSYVRVEDIVGLVVLLLGLMLYRFGHDTGEEDGDGDDEGSKGSYWEFLREPFMLSGDV